jgi:hypothetical protein
MRKLALLLCLLTGCTSTVSVPQYSFVFENASQEVIDNVGCGNDSGFNAAAGYLGIGKSKHDELIPIPIPEEVTLTWQTENGQKHTQRLKIKKSLPPKFTGEIVLTFTSGQEVTLSHRPYFNLPR